MHDMQMSQISKIGKYVDSGDIGKIDHLVRKDMIITQGLLLFSFIIAVCCLVVIIVFLYISFLHAKKKQLIDNQAGEPDV